MLRPLGGARSRRLTRHALWGGAVLAVLLPGAAQAATRAVATSGADSGACTTAAPCKTFGYAYRQAAAGDIVEVAAGSYASQSIPRVSGRTAPAVEFRPKSGATVSLGGLNV